jgi:hypothetical protein
MSCSTSGLALRQGCLVCRKNGGCRASLHWCLSLTSALFSRPLLNLSAHSAKSVKKSDSELWARWGLENVQRKNDLCLKTCPHLLSLPRKCRKILHPGKRLAGSQYLHAAHKGHFKIFFFCQLITVVRYRTSHKIEILWRCSFKNRPKIMYSTNT